jgi:hypothetical protein
MIMSTINAFVHTVSAYAPGNPRSITAGIGASVRLYWEALRDGLAALRHYNKLTARGVAHQTAVREIFVEHFGAR